MSLSTDELLTTTRAVRRRLDLTRPVRRELIDECVELAIQAPSGSNRQGWHFVFVDDPQRKAALAALYGLSFDRAVSTPPAAYGPEDPRAERQVAVRSSSTYLREHFHEVPVLLVPCAEGRLPPDAPVAAQAGFWGSVLPAVWSFMLAARARGLGTAFTTLHLPFEYEAAEVVGIPFDQVTQAGLIPVAHTIGTDFRPARRLRSSAVTHWNSW